MEKILSVCIPSYNMEKYLRRNLDSFIVSGCIEELELIVVNDGSKDKTLAIANEYKEKYPQTVVVIDKINGHYGSCVNAALKVAKGKFFRIVDADDWVDSCALKNIIKSLYNVNTDVVYTNYSTYYESENRTIHGNKPFASVVWNTPLILNEVKFENFVHMHQITYDTKFLRSIDYVQTEGICYTDIEYVFKPIVLASTIYFFEDSLYQYYIGRDDQSVSPSVAMKNYCHLYKVFISILNYQTSRQTNTHYDFLLSHYLNSLFSTLAYYFLKSQCKNKEIDVILRSMLSLLNDRKIDTSNYFKYTALRCPWLLWWYKNSYISKLKLGILLYLLGLRDKLIQSKVFIM